MKYYNKTMNRSQMMKLMYKLNNIFTFVNKFIYILPLFSLLGNISSIRKNKLFTTMKNLIKYLLIIQVIIGGFVILYFTDFTTPLNTTYSLYYDLLEPYIEIIKLLWNKVTNYFHNLINASELTPNKELEAIKSELSSQLKNEVKSGMKEAISEALDAMPDESNTKLYKSLALFGSGFFFLYFFCVLPGTTLNPEVLNEYHWINQGLIEIKVNILNFISSINKPGNPGSSSPSATGLLETVNSGSSDSTITPHYFRSPILKPVMIDTETQTILTGNAVSKSVEVVSILQDVLPTEEADKIIGFVNEKIKSITD